MIDRAALLADCKKQVRVLEDDLRDRAAEPGVAERLSAEWQEAASRERIAATYETWLAGQVTQAAVAWVLATVFLRFCEDNGLIDEPYLSGPGERATIAAERQEAYFATVEHRHETDREWILAGVAALSRAARGTPIVARLFDPAHNSLWRIMPSPEGAKDLIAFWRRRDEAGEILHDFTDRDLGTRFLGDLYQDLSEQARKQYALLQTPEFVERFILKYTLDPAIKEFGLTPVNDEGQLPGLRLIDPACGSGHFLLGAFDRLADEWADRAPALSPEQQVSRALASVHGVDKNPFAVSIARFRLLLAAMRRLEIRRLADARDFVINIAVGDSLLHGRDAPGIQEMLYTEPHHFVTEDVTEFQRSCDILGPGSYHVVVGNPPYITPKDKQENENYRAAYKSCSGKYALSVPFVERMFQLARIADADGHGSGFVGQITANSFMKREFGKKLIEEYVSQKVNLTYVIDTSGAYVPGHGTPTVILIGRRVMPSERQSVRAVLGVRGEPAQPAEPEKGLVWQAIVNQVDHPGSESEWVSAVDLRRSSLRGFPWSLSGGGASDLHARISEDAKRLAGMLDGSIGFLDITGDDDVYVSDRALISWVVGDIPFRRFVTGDDVRDWRADGDYVLWPYMGREPIKGLRDSMQFWPFRSRMRAGLTFGKTREQRGMQWHEHIMLSWERADAPMLITFACVATHNHFVLDESGYVCNRHAPVIKLPEGASEDEHLALLGVLNSSTACFWLKQVSHNKGSSVDTKGARQTTIAWENFYEFTGTKLQEFPLPADLPTGQARVLDQLAQRLGGVEPAAVCADGTPTLERLDSARAEHSRIRERMIALQEELDWDVYRRYGLISEADAAGLVAEVAEVPNLKLGERAFEIVLARSGAETQWFARHGSTRVTEIPEHWPEAYKRVVEARIRVIEERKRDIGLIERPECKRRWQAEPWEKKEAAALRAWLLDRCEDKGIWFDDAGQPRALTVNRLADLLRADADVVSVARLYAGKDADLAKVLDQIVADEHVPYLAAYRYKDSGLRKRAQWEDTWDKQREEDRTGTRLNIPVPPKYASADFTKNSYWRNRGKLDVPKERFVSYPGASPDGDRSLMLGWAGFDHAQQAHVLVDLIDVRATGASDADRDRLTSLIAGLREVMPWVRQWHGEKDELGTSPADDYAAVLEEQKSVHGLSDTDLDAWRPPKTRGGRH